jgi:hypothetical protein
MKHIPTPPLRRSRAWLLATLLTLASFAMLPLPARAEYGEYEVKAAVLTNFTQFVKWPAKAFADAAAPFAIGILGDDPFGSSLEKIVQGQSVGGRKITIRRGRSAGDLRNCQIVFISKSERGRVAEHVAGLQGANALIVGETPQFTAQGGAIGMRMEGDNVRFDINSGSAQRAGLEISSRLLKLSR